LILKNLSKKMMWNNKSFGESCTFGCKKPFALAICEECMGENI
jgi:hypothetical protein